MANLNRLKLVLVEKNKTGKWLAEQLGKSACTVSNWCQNNIQPDLPTLDKNVIYDNLIPLNCNEFRIRLMNSM